VDVGLPVDAIYLDFKKAFDKVPHGRLMSKIRGCGVDDKVYNWINNWLNGREQRVVIKGIHSDWCAVLIGIPQESVLGPLLFVIYINDVDISINNVILKFVDDTKIFAAVADSNAIESLRSELRRLYKWSNDWLMLFNIDKCKVLHFGSYNAKYDYMLGDQVLDSVSIERDLGVHIHDDLKVFEQCTEVVKTCNRILGMIKRSFTFRSGDMIVTL